MLNSPIRVGVMDESDQEEEYSFKKIGVNPFPGLRPFTMEECYLFFGRETQVDEILLKLTEHRSVTVMGYSGSGKSSLMYCGLLPVLYGGFMTRSGPFWSVSRSRPGSSPIANLTQSIVDTLLESKRIEEEDIPIHKAIISSVLRSGPNGLVEIAKYIQKDERENVLFLVDQFEEVFRHSDRSNEARNEATAYINLVTTAVQQKQVPVYVAMTMRSDFIGHSAAFHGLSEMINTSNYLIPQMTREQKRIAIEGPVSVSGGKITPRLLKRLLNELGDNQDQLPILQHAMMRTWDYWVDNHEPGEPIDIRHYNAIGKISQALSLHANEAYDELNTRQKEIASILFKAITEKNQENQSMRRPAKVGLIVELANAQEKEVIDVINNFRKPGRSFIVPGVNVVLHSDSVIELSHESLMRIWTRLSTWVDEEFESAKMYKRLSNSAEIYQEGKTSLWRPPDLHLALSWQKKNRPTQSWAMRYNDRFERAIVFLDNSRISYEADLKSQEMLQHRMLRRARVTNIVLGILLIVAILFFFYGLINSIEAEKNLTKAQAQQKLAEQATKEAQKQRDIAQRQTSEIKAKNNEIEAKNNELAKRNEQLRQLLYEKDVLQKEAETNFKLAKVQRDSARDARDIAKREYIRAEANYKENNARLMLSIAQSLEAKSEGIDDKDLAGAMAMQGYLYNTQFGGKKYDPYVFRGLYYALTKLYTSNYNAVKMPGTFKSKMFALAVSQSSANFFVTGNDGRIFQGDFQEQKIIKQIDKKQHPNKVLALSNDEQFLVNGSDSSYLEVFNLVSLKKRTIAGHNGLITALKFLPDNSSRFISSSVDGTLRLTNAATGDSKKIVSFSYEIKSIDISRDGKTLVAASPAGKLVLVDLRDYSIKELKDESPNRILSVAFHPTRPIVAYGVENLEAKKGTVKLININSQKIEKELTGHKAGISDLEFSPDGLLLASAGLDRKLQMWVVDHVEDLPIVMDNNNGYVWNLAFTKGSEYLVASCNDGEVRIWPTDPKMLAEKVCPKLSRNMTPEEWNIYVGNGVLYEPTCKSLLIKSF
ncbi:MAG: High-affnity carbon uptake protein Hat/HatR [Cytophagales bacterium]|jgi:energy-coupling factor transporter ATP-binding protein EcfA2|nr:High-affnity carbon uptake protein Hat/HatR [Bacteroidota bacterium]MBS1982481.1 High-affnity carbon uptake protein Hat/HatR [Bacteroidota bacterium]WHZ06252.1 MAG: High-affnity carbon uptake protein Hat/HatR [Cytophagales bacterium]